MSAHINAMKIYKDTILADMILASICADMLPIDLEDDSAFQ
jgi:hypothetical protein